MTEYRQRPEPLLPVSAAPKTTAGRRPKLRLPSPVLEEHERLFVLNYMIDFDHVAAAIRAGYNGADGIALMRLPHIADAIKYAIAQRSAITGLNAQRVLDRLGALALANPKELYEKDGRLKNIHDIPDEHVVLISGIKTRKQFVLDENGEVQEAEIQEVRHVDQLAALRDAMKHLGMMTERKEITVNVNAADRLDAARNRLLGRGGSAPKAIDAEFEEIPPEAPPLTFEDLM